MLIIISLFYLNIVSSEAAQKLLSPKSLDYRQNGLVSKTVYNEKSCKAGWAFALIGEIEGQYAKRGDGFMDISVQQLIDCMPKCAGCSHCDAKTALKSLLRLNGLQKSDTYPFVAKKQSCRYRPDKIEVYIGSFTLYELKDENDLKKLLEANGPLYIALDSTDLVGHKDGVIKKCSYNKLNHAVLLIGYGSENGEDYWLVKNSWGSTWGHQGVGKLARGTNICGLMNSDFFTIDLQ